MQTAWHSPRPVVVGVDGSTSSTRAVRWAADQAAMWGCPLRLVHAHVWPMIHRPEVAGLPADYRDVLLDLGRGWLANAAQAATEVAPEIAVSTDLVVARAAQLLIEESAAARLVVVGSRGLGGFTGLMIGSTAVALAAHARCPLAVVRTPDENQDPPSSGPVVLGVNGPPASEAAIGFAFEAASLRKAPLVALHAWSCAATPAYPPRYLWSVIEQDERRLLDERLHGWQQKFPDVRVDLVVTDGRPADGLLHAAEDAQLVVVGSRGRGGLGGLLLGSTSHALLHHAPCPVVVARPEYHGGRHR